LGHRLLSIVRLRGIARYISPAHIEQIGSYAPILNIVHPFMISEPGHCSLLLAIPISTRLQPIQLNNACTSDPSPLPVKTSKHIASTSIAKIPRELLRRWIGGDFLHGLLGRRTFEFDVPGSKTAGRVTTDITVTELTFIWEFS
jgi:hypothetical protein